MKYKVGSLIRIKNIKSVSEAEKLANYGYHTKMLSFSGRVFRIINSYESPGYPNSWNTYILQEQDISSVEDFGGVGDWSWVEQWLEPAGRIKIRIGDLV